MQTTARSLTADEYIRRIDRMLVITSLITAALAVGLFALMT
jgi:hypothetical protein